MMGEIFCTAAVKTARFHEIAIALSRSQRTHFVSLSSLLEGRVDIKGEILLRHNMSEIIFSRFRCVSLSFTLTSVPTNHCFHFFLDGCRILTEYPTLRFCHFFMQTLTEWYRKFKCVQPSGSPPSLESLTRSQHVVSIGFAIISGVVV